MLGRTVLVITGICAAALSACGSSTSGTSTASPSPTPHAGATPTPTPGGGGAPTGTPGPINPCSLLTQDEASTMEGVTLGPGTLGGAGIGRLCVYGNAGTKSSATVGIGQTPSVADAQAALADEEHDLSGFVVTQLPTFADGGYIARKSDGSLELAGLYARDGTTFFFVTGTNPAPSDGALKVAALLVLGSLP